jgi:hypothetical protein
MSKDTVAGIGTGIYDTTSTIGDWHEPPLPTAANMTLRDWFAGKAMQGFAVATKFSDEISDVELARASYELADAMLLERAK